MLVLFDIDGTILITRHAGIRAMADAMAELAGREVDFDGIDTAGRLDPLIWADAAARNGIETGDGHHERFRAAYGRHLDRRLRLDGTAELLPGVRELVEALAECEGLTLGLLTGNYPETGRMKIDAAGLDSSVFTIGAWGCDGPTRRHLPRVAMEVYEVSNGGAIDPQRVLIIGDTPHDIDCARHNGCRVLAVATGRFSVEDLAAHAPDRLEADLQSTDDLVSWIHATSLDFPSAARPG